MRVHGGCHCGAITYEAEIDPSRVALCHCADRQVMTGTAFSTFVPVPREAFRLNGTPKIYVKTAESGNRRAQASTLPKSQTQTPAALGK
ncbi:MAG TPA: GFA family protein [Burkholderiales bacterium]|nr:GFA family protein [Burkholderiales bacterium]